MEKRRLKEFRLFYNQTIAPELLRLERERMRLVSLLAVSVFILGVVFAFEFYLNILALTLILSIPTGIFVVYLITRIDEFRRKFKPKVVRLILDFIDDGLNFDPENPLQYDYKGFISRETFFASRLFDTPAQEFTGEDRIEGKVGEMFFELSELRVGEISVLRSHVNAVFNGVFLHSVFNEPTSGELIVWPRRRLQFLTRSIRAFTFKGGKNKDKEILHEPFREMFMTYAKEDTPVHHILTQPMQEALANFVHDTGKELYFSILDNDIYIGLWNEKDLLEPYILRSNLSFERVREFFDDIHSLLYLVEVFDQMR